MALLDVFTMAGGGSGVSGITVNTYATNIKPATPFSQTIDLSKNYLVVVNGDVSQSISRLHVWQILKGEVTKIYTSSGDTVITLDLTGTTLSITSTSSLSTGYQPLLFEID